MWGHPLKGLGYCDLVSSIKKLADFPGETFRVLKEKEEREYGEYQMRRLILDAWFWRCEIG
jgi:hypothetical protein